MSSSVTTLAPAGQQHDREDADMGEATSGTNDSSLTNGVVAEPPLPANDRVSNSNTIAVQVAAIDEDAMDTTPDIDTELVLQDGSAGLSQTIITPSSPPTHEAVAEPASHELIPPAAPLEDVVSQAWVQQK
jgi:hypothetical protein